MLLLRIPYVSSRCRKSRIIAPCEADGASGVQPFVQSLGLTSALGSRTYRRAGGRADADQGAEQSGKSMMGDVGTIQQAKLVLLGDMGAGKSSLVLRFVKGQFFDYQVGTRQA